MMPRLIWFLLVFLFSQVKSQCPQYFQEQPGTGYCYGIFADALSGTEADNKCVEKVAAYPGVGHLASIRDKQSWQWIKTTFAATMASVTTGIWFGLYDTGSDTFAWRDGRPFCPWITNDSVNCGPNNPWTGFPNGINQRPGLKSCVSLHQRVWNETDCGGVYRYYCAREDPGVCPSPSFGYPPGNCLLEVKEETKWRNFTEAGKYCVSQGFPYVWPAKEEAHIAAITSSFTYSNPHNAWIGLSTDGSGDYTFTDDPNRIALRKNAFWSTGQPNGGANAQQCVSMTAQDNWKWDDEDCSQARAYMCQYNIIAIERGKAHLSPNDISCESPAKSLLVNLTKTRDLWDGNSNTFVEPFSGAGTTKYRVLVELFEIWRGHPAVSLKGSNLQCLPTDGMSVVLLLDNRKVNCYLWRPDGTPHPNGPTNECYYWCDTTNGMVNYISISFKKVIANLKFGDVSIFDQMELR